MVDQLRWLGKEDEVRFSEQKFRGKESGMIYRYGKQIDGLIRCRAVIFILAFWNLYPAVVGKLQNYPGATELLIERGIFAILFIASALLFNKSRILALIIAILPASIIILENVIGTNQINLYGIAFSFAAMLLILSGFYHHFKAKQIRKELMARQLENEIQTV